MISMTAIQELQTVKVSTEDFQNSFKAHLDDNTNHRILFSGKYGSGKTTFLKDYFEANEQNYNVIHLYPVNYQVAKNEDIFELLKYDILSELIGEHGFSDIEEFSSLLTFQSYLLNDGGKYLLEFMKSLPKLGKYVKGGENLVKFVEGLQNLKKKDSSEQLLTEQFVSIVENQPGNLYEFDACSQLICSKLQEIKSSSGCDSVLVIDDLDRVDPSHLFRLLNIFSAHFDQQNFENDPKQNKFGFDKIIVVCDLHNVKNIFKSQFGIDSDCNGYIDKFYSKEVFWFENQINWLKKLKSFLEASIKKNNINGDEGNDYIYDIITDLIRNQSISPRKLIFKNTTPIYIPELEQRLWYMHYSESVSSTIILRIYIFLISFFDNDFEELIKELEKLKEIEITLFGNSVRGGDRKIFNIASYKLSKMQVKDENASVSIQEYVVDFDLNLGRGTFSHIGKLQTEKPSNDIYSLLILLLQNVHSVLRKR